MELFIAFAFGFLLGNGFIIMMDDMARKHKEKEENKNDI